jgi:hypothetical protein
VSAAGEDWLGDLDLDEMSLDGVEAPAPAEAPVDEPPEVQVSPAAPTQAPDPVDAPVAAAGDGGGQPGLLSLVMTAKDRPEEAAEQLGPGITSPAFILQTVASLLVLWVLNAGAAAYLQSPADFEIRRAVANFLWLAVEFGAAAVMVGLVCLLSKRDTKPLGAVEGVAAVRVVSLVLMLPVTIGLVALMAVVFEPGVGAPAAVWTCVRWAPRVWGIVTFALQAVLLVGLVGFGCWVPVVLSLVFCYGAATLASMAIAFLQ